MTPRHRTCMTLSPSRRAVCRSPQRPQDGREARAATPEPPGPGTPPRGKPESRGWHPLPVVFPAISLPTFPGFGRKPPELGLVHAIPRHQKADGGLGEEFVEGRLLVAGEGATGAA